VQARLLAGFRERAAPRHVSDHVIPAHVVGDASEPFRDVVVVQDGKAAGLLRDVRQPLLRVAVECDTVSGLLANQRIHDADVGLGALQVVSCLQSTRLEPSRVERVNHDTGPGRGVDETVEHGSHTRIRLGLLHSTLREWGSGQLRHDHLETFGHEDDRLTSGKTARPPDHQVQRAKRSGRRARLTKLIDDAEVVRVHQWRTAARTTSAECGVNVDGLETLNGVARHDVPPDAVDSGVQHTAVGRERLQRAHGASGAHQRDEVGRPQLAIDERVERATHVLDTLDREAEVVHDQRECSLHVLFFDRRQRRRRQRGSRRNGRNNGWRCGSGIRVRTRKHRHELCECDRLRLAVLPHFEVGRGQVGNDTAVPICDDGIDAYRVHANPEARCGGGLLRGHR
jgi:hypothetical protein